MMSQIEKPIGLKVKEEKIANVELPKLDCSMMDKRTRKILVYLVNEELKRYKSYPKSWVGDATADLEGIKAAIEMCETIRSRKRLENAGSGSSTEGKSGIST